jgi:hypothetical protein
MMGRALLPPSPNICPFEFFIPTLTIRLIKKIKVMKKIKYILKLHYVINHIIIKIHNNCNFDLNRMSGQSWCKKSKQQIFGDGGSISVSNP